MNTNEHSTKPIQSAEIESLPTRGCLHQLFEAQVERSPEAIAACCNDATITYRQLNQQANRLARQLIEQGVGPDVVVGLAVDRGLPLLVAIIGIFKAGGAYLPLNHLDPAERLAKALSQSGIRLILAEPSLQPILSEALDLCPVERRPQVVLLDDLLQRDGADDNLPVRAQPDNLAYVFFTSGSTGQPKGAMVQQKGMLNHCYAKLVDLDLNAADTIAQTASPWFDVSVWQLLAPLLVGGRVEIIKNEIVRQPARLLETIAGKQITILELVPSLLQLLLEHAERLGAQRPTLPALRWAISTGEALPPQICRHWFAVYPGIPLLNAYGPTECSDRVSHFPMHAAISPRATTIPIGHPIANTQLYILSEQMQPVPAGMAGELYVGGMGVGRGYLNDPARTAASFVPHPFNGAGARLYRTGDLVRLTPDAQIEFLGRVDFQVKISGVRVEMGEIEAVLEEHPAVRRAVVTARDDAEGRQRLVAYVVPQAEPALASGQLHAEQQHSLRAQLRAFVQQRLPPHMLPAAFVQLDALPLTPNGKVNRRALPATDLSDLSQADALALPRTPLEAYLSQICAHALGVDQIGILDNFFQLGAHSLIVAHMLGQIHSDLGLDLPFHAIASNPSVAALTEYLQSLPDVAAHDLHQRATAASDTRRIDTAQPTPQIDDTRYPITYFQRKYVAAFLDDPSTCAALIVEPYLVRGKLDVERIKAVLHELIEQHVILRSVIVPIDGLLYHQALEHYAYDVPVTQHHSDRAFEEAITAAIADEEARPFDLHHDVLVRSRVLMRDDQRWGLILTFHHLIVDQRSLGLFAQALFARYTGAQPAQPALQSAPFAHYAWREHMLTTQPQSPAFQFWRDHLRQAQHSAVAMGSSWHAGAAQEYSFVIDEAQGDSIRAFCHGQYMTPSSWFMALYAALLGAALERRQIAIGMTMSMRIGAETRTTIGPLINHPVFNIEVQPETTF
ncbi:MAG TPA: amino acid adenylation domain-containing protein, partial [Herpetosiphonaceae bacterium]